MKYLTEEAAYNIISFNEGAIKNWIHKMYKNLLHGLQVLLKNIFLIKKKNYKPN